MSTQQSYFFPRGTLCSLHLQNMHWWKTLSIAFSLMLVSGMLATFNISSVYAASNKLNDCDFGTIATMAYQANGESKNASTVKQSPIGDVCEHTTKTLGMEPMIAVNSKGTIFMGLPTNYGVFDQIPEFYLQGNMQSYMLRSRDDGRTWQKLALPLGQTMHESLPYIDPVTDRLFWTSTNPSAMKCGAPVMYSDDEGQTWKQTKRNPGCEPEVSTIGDWPKIFTGPFKGKAPGQYPNAVYLCNYIPNQLVAQSIGCWRSDNGGENFTFTGYLPVKNHTCTAGSVKGGEIATIVHGTGQVLPNGDVVIPVTVCGTVVSVKSTDAGRSWEATNTGGISGGLKQTLLGNESLAQNIFQNMFFDQTLAQDAHGNLFLAYTREGVHLAVSTDGGNSWKQLGCISAPEVSGAIDVSITARGNGEVALAWFGTHDRTDKIFGFGEKYRGWITYSKNALAAKPVFHSAPTSKLSDPPQITNTTGCCASFKVFVEFSGVKFTGPNTVRAAFVRWGDKQLPYLVYGKLNLR